MNAQEFYRRATWGPFALAMLAALVAGLARLAGDSASSGWQDRLDAVDLLLLISVVAAVGSLPASLIIRRWLKRRRTVAEIRRVLWGTPVLLGIAVMCIGTLTALFTSKSLALSKTAAWSAGVMIVAFSYTALVETLFIVGRRIGKIEDGTM